MRKKLFFHKTFCSRIKFNVSFDNPGVRGLYPWSIVFESETFWLDVTNLISVGLSNKPILNSMTLSKFSDISRKKFSDISRKKNDYANSSGLVCHLTPLRHLKRLIGPKKRLIGQKKTFSSDRPGTHSTNSFKFR